MHGQASFHVARTHRVDDERRLAQLRGQLHCLTLVREQPSPLSRPVASMRAPGEI